ncbi:MAG: response regulator transcription factor [Acidobacteria bacterium]|nr:response regulator transcription factor [Acidobacteriota bacterium]
MKVLLLSARPLGASGLDHVLLNSLHPTAVDVCPTLEQCLVRLEVFPPDVIVVSLASPEAAHATRRLQEQAPHLPVVVVMPPGAVAWPVYATQAAPSAESISADRADGSTGARHGRDVIGRGAEGAPAEASTLRDDSAAETRFAIELALADARDELTAVRARGSLDGALDAETRWLLYDVASIGHVSTTPTGEILASNDVAAQLLGHFSPQALEASGLMPAPLLDAAGAYARRPTRFELCLQHGDDGPLHWIVGLALPQGGSPATVTWFLIDVSEQRLQARRARFLRRMEALTHVLSAATAECATLVDAGRRALDAARDVLPSHVDVDDASHALTRTQAVLTQLAGFARRRARRPVLRDIRSLLEQMAPVLVHITGDDVSWGLDTGEHALYASLDASELEQCLSSLVTQGREALPLGGQVRLTLRDLVREASIRDGRGARPEIEIAIELRGYGLQPLVVPPAVQTQALRIGAELASTQPDHLTSRITLLLPRVFVTS